MASLVPYVGQRGLFALTLPFNLQANTSYRCIAIRSFLELSQQGVDVYDAYYNGMGLSQNTYSQDSTNGVVIVALRSDGGNMVYVPSSYIASTPDISGSAYARRFVTLDLGMLPVDTDISPVMESLEGLVEARIGVVTQAKQATSPVTNIVSEEDASAIEAGRLGRITEQGSDYSLYQKSLKTIADQQVVINQLTQMCRTAGLITSTP